MLTIGAFSKLSHVSARMLRHYDALGLLRPALKGAENGYRYYDMSQLATLRQIETLKDYGFPLSEIKALLPLSREELALCIHRRRLEACRELEALRASLRRMEADILKMEGNRMLKDSYRVIVMQQPAQRVFGLERTISISQVHNLFQELYQCIKERGLTRAGAAQLAYLGDEFNYEAMHVQSQVEVAGTDPDIQVIPAQTYLATTHTGPYDTVKYAYDAICAYLAEHPEYQVSGPAVERYLKDEDEVQSPEDLETGILFPVRKLNTKDKDE